MDALQDFWFGIPYLVFTIPFVSRVVFYLPGVHNTHEITHSIESFGHWLYTPSERTTAVSRANPKVYDLIIAFFESSSYLTTLDWAVATREAADRVELLQLLLEAL
jgi:hypothetical protein